MDIPEHLIPEFKREALRTASHHFYNRDHKSPDKLTIEESIYYRYSDCYYDEMLNEVRSIYEDLQNKWDERQRQDNSGSEGDGGVQLQQGNNGDTAES